jgi:hypothetical protein
MTLRGLIGLLIVLAVFGGAGYLLLFEREWVFAWFNKAVQQAKGYTPAKTPQEALDKFKAAVRERNYEAAALYCGPDYAEQLRKVAPVATPLARAIDDLLHNMEQEAVKSEKVQIVLKYLEPFPKDIKIIDVREEAGKGKAVAQVAEDTGRPIQAHFTENWKVDTQLMRALFRDLPPQVELKQEGDGDDKHWRILFPVTAGLRTAVDHLKDKGMDYKKALEKVKLSIKRDAATKADLEKELRTEMEAASE